MTDRLSDVEKQPLRPDSLVGSFFHSYCDNGETRWQGCVVAEPAPGFLLVELFSWVMGESSNQELVRVEDMVGWSFYDTADWMRNSYHPPKREAGELVNGGDFILGKKS